MTRGYPDYEGQKSGVWGMAEWSAHEGQQKRFLAGGINKVYGDSSLGQYTVPAGKTVYITALAGSCWAEAAASANNNQMCEGLLLENITPYVRVGGNGGFSVTFPTPVIFAAGETVTIAIYNWSNNTCYISVFALGWEV